MAVILAAEGGYSADPADPGGQTNLGITAATLREAQQRGVVHQTVTVRDLTVEQAKTIYRAFYWLPIRGDELPRAIALATFDAAVNQGVKTAILMLQAAVGTQPDGVVGPKTISAALRLGLDAVDSLLAIRMARYADLVAARPVLLRFRHGWFRRCARTARLAAQAEAA